MTTSSRKWRPGAALLALAGSAALAIVNGSPPAEARYRTEFPWAVALEYEGATGVCSAQLIAPQWVLTAGHCTSMNARVRAGHLDRTRSTPVPAAQAITHPRYDPKTGAHDIGLIRLARALPYPPVPLMAKWEAPALLREGARAVIAGYGVRSSSAGFSERLVVSDVELASLKLDDGRFVFYDPVSGPCGGDSGGPLLLERPDGTRVLAGVASRVVGNICAQGGGIAMYVNVAEARDFIVQHVRGLPP